MAIQQDKRRFLRRLFTVDGHLYGRDGASLCTCRFQDVSTSGARVGVEQPGEIPDDVIVVLSRNGSVRRRGKVVWRKDAEIGIRFVARKQPR